MTTNPLQILLDQLAALTSKGASMANDLAVLQEAIKENSQDCQYLKRHIALIESGTDKLVASLSSEKRKKSGISLADRVRGLFSDGVQLTVQEACDKLEIASDKKASLNTTLHVMVKKGFLEKVSLGVYKKAQKE